MWQRVSEPEGRRPAKDQSQQTADVQIVFLLLSIMVVSLVSTLPMVLVLPALSLLLALVSLPSVTVAVLCREGAFDERPTHWDQAAVLMALSLLAGLFTDVAAVNAFLETLSPDGLRGTQAVVESSGAPIVPRQM